MQANLVCAQRLKQLELDEADLVLTVPLPDDVQLLAFERAGEIIAAGRAAAKRSLPALREWLTSPTQLP